MNIETADCIEAGQGETVILLHSSVAGAKQWRSLMAVLAENYHTIAINLLGYGKTPGWQDSRPQSLQDQAALIAPFLPGDDQAVSIVGHSFGGSVAMKAAAMFKPRVRRLVLIEPNPFYLLRTHGRVDAYQEAVTLQDVIKSNGAKGTWGVAAEFFADYWTGAGSWDAMPPERRMKFAEALQPNFHEWDAVMNEQTSLPEWARDLPRKTTVISAQDTVRSIHEIVELMQEHAAGWRFEQIEHGGHMAAMTLPDIINPIVANALR